MNCENPFSFYCEINAMIIIIVTIIIIIIIIIIKEEIFQVL